VTDACADEQLDEQLNGSLLLAVAEQKLEMVADCIARGVDPNASPLKDCSPLVLAIKLGSFEIVKLLVKGGAACHESGGNGMTVVHHAAVLGHSEIAHHLCSMGGAALDQCNQVGCTPLYQAAQHGHVECVKTFVSLGANIDARTRTGATPLYIASDRGNLELVDLLLAKGCDKNPRTVAQMTPLLVAAFNGHKHVIQRLIENNVDIEQRGPCGGTALYVAAQEGRQSVAEFLLQSGAVVDASCDGQLTPSLIAAMQGHAEMVRSLLQARGDVGVRSDKGSTIAIMAARHGQQDVLKVLVEMGGVKVFECQNEEGLCALGASIAGRHKDVTAYIKSAIAVQKEADLSAWEATLPDILQELAPPQSKGRSKRKGKAKNRRETSTSAAAVDSPSDAEPKVQSDSILVGVEEIEIAPDVGPADIGDEPTVDSLDVSTSSAPSGDEEGLVVESEAENGDAAELAEKPWTQVRGKGGAQTHCSANVNVAFAPSGSVPAAGRVPPMPPPMLSPMLSWFPSDPVKALAPMLSQVPGVSSGPVTPASALPSTPCMTSSPMYCHPSTPSSPFHTSVLPPWPPTPDPLDFQDSIWACLPPPAVGVGAFSSGSPEKSRPVSQLPFPRVPCSSNFGVDTTQWPYFSDKILGAQAGGAASIWSMNAQLGPAPLLFLE